VVNVLAADELIRSPQVYATLLLWMLAELFERLPEVGDPEKPRLVFFFDEAHLLFEDAPRELLERIEQVVRLVRSKGVGVYFVTQNPLDLPDTVLAQLGNRVQHALRAFTPRDQKAVRAAAETFRANPGVDTERAITELGVGEALVSFLDEKGTPHPVQRALVYPPRTRFEPLAPEERAAILGASPLGRHYQAVTDRESAYERLKSRAESAAAEGPRAGERARGDAGAGGGWAGGLGRSGEAGKIITSVARSAASAAGTQIGRAIMRGLLGSILGGGRTRR
jgi:DNA helicase HerA-like ATPase